jgi:hypothetical protein
MKRAILILLAMSFSLSAYSIFNTRGLGCYTPPREFLDIDQRTQTSLEARFIAEYVYATDDSTGGQSAFLLRPELFRFYLPLVWRFGLGTEIAQRFNLDFTVESDSAHSSDYTLIRTVKGRGGIEGLRVYLDKSFYDIVYLGAGYERLFGGAWERWDSEVVELGQTTVDSLLYFFGGNGFWGMAGLRLGPVEFRGFYGYPLDLKVTTEVQTSRDTAVVDSASYTPPGELGGIVTYSANKLRLGAAYVQQTASEATSLCFVPGRLIQVNASGELKPFVLTGKAGWRSWYVESSDGSPIRDIYLGLGMRIPIESYGYGIVEVSGGLRNGGSDISEYHLELYTGLEFRELWKRRERMWGG